MKAIVAEGFGGPEVLVPADVERPEPGVGQILIRVVATSVNRPDIVQRQGNYPPPKGDSEIIGLEVAGLVEAVGDAAGAWKPGDRVMALVGGGGYAEFAVGYATHAMRVPDSMSFHEAACVCETYITAYLNVFMLGKLRDGDSVLLHGGGGGVNTAGIQLCKVLAPGARVCVTASPRKLDRVRELGADLVIDYTSSTFADVVRDFTDRRGVDVILDHIGAKYLAGNMKSLAVGGRLVIIGVTSGASAEVNLALMMVKRQQILGSVLRSRPVEEKSRIIEEFSTAVLPRFAARDIVPLIDQVLPLEQAAEAHRIMEASAHFGKIVLFVANPP